ncbi:GIY-YIG nuclease family protein [Paucibacter sp. JuS9]|uniref:GIY-YIG nuclease family protein n=1 Tax=Paucibacter sp. JuS9 TaxID=3228748 RepID=UPI0037582CBD
MAQNHSSPSASAPAAVYLLQRSDRMRFKIGWALNPVERVRAFPEFCRMQLDLNASRVLWLPSAARARAIERSMHRALEPFTSRPPHQEDGHSEWFSGLGTVAALSLLARMPHAPGQRPATLAPLLELASQVPEPTGLDDTWCTVEDVLLRLKACTSVRLMPGDPPSLVIESFKTRVRGALDDLRTAALDAELYTCRQGSALLPLVRLIEYQGDDLVLTLTPFSVIRRWPGGGDVVLQMLAFLAQLCRVGEGWAYEGAA